MLKTTTKNLLISSSDDGYIKCLYTLLLMPVSSDSKFSSTNKNPTNKKYILCEIKVKLGNLIKVVDYSKKLLNNLPAVGNVISLSTQLAKQHGYC